MAWFLFEGETPMDTSSEIVRERWIEAAEIETRMFVKGMSQVSNGWPAYLRELDDLLGYDDQARRDHLEVWQGRKTVKARELSAWEEVYYGWSPLVKMRDRTLVWRWAFCIALGRSFSAYCERKGIVRRTAYNRLEKAFSDLAAQLAVEGFLLKPVQQSIASQLEAGLVGEEHTVERTDAKCVPTIHPPFRSEKPRDLLKTPEAIEAFIAHRDEVNEQRRKARLRKALRGVPGEQEAA